MIQTRWMYDPSDAVVTLRMLVLQLNTNTIVSPLTPTPFAVNDPETVNDEPGVGVDEEGNAVSMVEMSHNSNITVIAECKKSDKAWIFYTPPMPLLTKEGDPATIAYVCRYDCRPSRSSWRQCASKILTGREISMPLLRRLAAIFGAAVGEAI